MLLERCGDYYVMAEGRPPSKEAAKSEFTDLPPGQSVRNVLVIGIRCRREGFEPPFVCTPPELMEGRE